MNNYENWRLRHNARFEVQLTVIIFKIGNSTPIYGKVLNISRSGMFVELSTEGPWPDKTSEFHIHLSDQEKSIAGKGVVRWVRRASSEGNPSGCGMEFIALDPNSKSSLLDLINQKFSDQDLNARH